MRRGIVALSALGAVAAAATVTGLPAADAATAPVSARPATAAAATATTAQPVMSADALPTAQIDGVVWSQVISGDTVFAGGRFANARPAGSAPGVNTVRRTDLMAYSISTGVMTGFAPVMNGQVRATAVSPDGTRLYVGGDFTVAGSITRNRIAAFDVRTGRLISTFAPSVNGGVDAIVATATGVYFGGNFTAVNGIGRSRLAVVSLTGTLTGWAPSANYSVTALVMTPDRSLVIAGGGFSVVNGRPAYGLAALGANSGALAPWAVASIVRDYGRSAGITSLSTDGTSVFGTGYTYAQGGNFEGTFSVVPDSGALRWLEDCHGDSYGAYATGGQVYVVSHAHYCGNVGGFGETIPKSNHRATAFVNAASGTAQADPYNYASFTGRPTPTMVNWFPDLLIGAATGQDQAAWSITGNGRYLVLGGEFPSVNGVAQQGLVRFTTTANAPDRSGPMVSGGGLMPRLKATSPTSARLTFQTDWDRDDSALSYALWRNDSSAPIWTGTLTSTFWNRPTQTVLQTDLTPGTAYTYQLVVSDPAGNQAVGNPVTWTAPTVATRAMDYATRVVADGARAYYPLNESSGSSALDQVGFQDATALGTLTRLARGPVAGDPASTLSATTIVLDPAGSGPFSYSEQLWLRTTSTAGGPLMEYGNSRTATSPTHDREVYLRADGRVAYSVATGGGHFSTLLSPTPVNDGEWHQVTAAESPAGTVLFVDGAQVGSSPSHTTPTNTYLGVWRVGSENLSGWPGASTSTSYSGDLAEVAVYPAPLSADAVLAQYVASGRGQGAPTDTYGAAVYADDPASYWRLDDPTTAGAGDASGHANTAAYTGDVLTSAPGALVANPDAAAQFGPVGVVAATNPVTDPETFSQEAWIRTGSTTGGVIVDLGSTTRRTASNSLGRVLYMGADGLVLFSVDGVSSLSSPTALNDGRWHHLVTTAGPAGTALYVDGVQVASGAAAAGPATAGYWRVGGDGLTGAVDQPTTTSLRGSIDEVAIYRGVLPATRISAHHAAGVGPYQGPTASFTASSTSTTAQLDATGSADAGAASVSYAWDFGDGTPPGSDVTVSHTFGAAGTYSVTLTVTDDRGGSATTAQSITVTD